MMTGFNNRPEESLYKAYKRYRGFVANFPHHGLPPCMILHIFYAGLCPTHREELDIISERSFTEYSIEKAWRLLELHHIEKETYDAKKWK
jgi:hypothetical protein